MNKKTAKLLKRSLPGTTRQQQRNILEIYKKAPWNKRKKIKDGIREVIK